MRNLQSKIELLAPAGSFQGFIGAINGGADAVYLAGDKFGARAYADNFTQDELKEVLFLAKLFDVKVYLTVNTLLKNTEMNELYDYIKPLYDLGLNGVIIQDFGVFSYLKEHFPVLELHASTQMTVTSLKGAQYLTKQGMKRVVLARELTLKEIKEITAAGIETECFIHGSMCYCYSGQCLFSSLIGQRSGNRGRCAQPCRLPYKANGSKNEEYCLSLKDMCTLEHLPELIESGIASFKIEGRMKNPAYAAFVTKMYRKYIDAYQANHNKPYRVNQEDLNKLKSLYIRTALQDGYYHKYHGEDMITKESPAYSKTDDALVAEITAEMIHEKPQKGIRLYADFTVGQPCTLYAETTIGENVYSAYVTGADVQEALKAPISKEAIKERLSKTGDSYFAAEVTDVCVNGNVFLPVKAINELRRNALEELKNVILQGARPSMDAKAPKKIGFRDSLDDSAKRTYIAFIEEKAQLQPVLDTDYISCIVLPYSWLLSDDAETLKKKCEQAEKGVYFTLPAVCRNESFERVEKALNKAQELGFGRGVYVNQSDSAAYITTKFPQLQCIGDFNLYAMNNVAVEWLTDQIDGYTVPVELNKDEIRHLDTKKGELILYGRTALMQSANCIFLTTGKCQKNNVVKVGMLTDRTKVKFPYRVHCEEKVCYNTIYNSVPTSLHKHKKIVDLLQVNKLQLRFTIENAEETRRILDFYKEFECQQKLEDAPFAYTNGHFMRGVQ